MSAEAADAYLTELGVIFEEVGADALDAAVIACRRECRFMPSVAELRERAGLNQKKAEHAEAQQAWLVVLEYIRKGYTSGYREYIGRDPNTGESLYRDFPELPERMKHAVRIAGGFHAIEETTDADLHFRRDDFIEAYENYHYIQEFPLQLSTELRHLLPGAARLKALPARREVTEALIGVEQLNEKSCRGKTLDGSRNTGAPKQEQ